MSKILTALLFMAAHAGAVVSTTTNMGLLVVPKGTYNWDVYMNANANIVDSSAAIKAKANIFTATQTINAPLIVNSSITANTYYGNGANLVGINMVVPSTYAARIDALDIATATLTGNLASTAAALSGHQALTTTAHGGVLSNGGGTTTNNGGTLQISNTSGGSSFYGVVSTSVARLDASDSGSFMQLVDTANNDEVFFGITDNSFIHTNYNVGIGTRANSSNPPTHKLEVTGGGYFQSSVTASAFYGSGAALTNVAGDNLGNHVATTTLNMNTFNITGAGSVTSSSLTVTGATASIGAGKLTVDSGGIVHINSDASAGVALGVSGQIYASQAITSNSGFYGSGVGLTAVPAASLTGTVPTGSVNLSTVTANHVLKAGDTMSGPLTISGSSFTVTGDIVTFGKVGVNLGGTHTAPVYALDVSGTSELHGQVITLGSMTVTGAQGLGVTYGVNAATFTAATAFYGPATGLTAIPATQLTGTVPTGSVDLSTVTTAINLKLSSPTVNGQAGWVLTYDNGLEPTWQPAPSAAGLTYVFVSSASDVSGYTQMVSAANYVPSPRSTTTVTNPSVNQYISSKCTNVGYPGITTIPAGVWSSHKHMVASNANRFRVKFEAYIRNANGTEHEYIENVEQTPFLATSEAEYNMAAVGVSTNILTTDRICYKLKVTVAAGAGTITVYDDGQGASQTNSRLEMPSVAASVANFVPYTGSVSAVDLGANNLTTTGKIVTPRVSLNTAAVAISSETSTALGAGVRISSNVYIVGFSSATKYYGDGSSLTGISATGFIPSTATGNYDLRVATATYLATAPGACSAGQYISGLTADGTKTCGTPSGAGDVLLASTQTFTGSNTFNSSSTFNGTIYKGAVPISILSTSTLITSGSTNSGSAVDMGTLSLSIVAPGPGIIFATLAANLNINSTSNQGFIGINTGGTVGIWNRHLTNNTGKYDGHTVSDYKVVSAGTIVVKGSWYVEGGSTVSLSGEGAQLIALYVPFY